MRGWNLLFPYWWCHGRDKTPKPLSTDYVELRMGLRSANLNEGRLIGSIPATLANSDTEKAVDWLYQLLTVLDSKASALMRLNGVMLAAAAFLLNLQVFNLRLIWGIAALSSISIALCLLVVSVDWPFLGLVNRTNNQVDFTDEVYNLKRVSKFREVIYRISWLISFVATLMFVAAFVSQLF